MHLNKLEMKNFKKFRRTELNFSDGLTGILGSNGAGKSTIVEAIAWALYGNRASSIKRDFLRNSRAKESDAVEVGLTISLGRSELFIHRAIRGRAMTPDARLFLDGQRIATGSREVDLKLAEILRISYQDFMKTFYARQKDLDNLLKEGGMGKREYLLKLLGLEDIRDHALELIKADRAVLEAEKSRLFGALSLSEDVSERLLRCTEDISNAGAELSDAVGLVEGLLSDERMGRQELEAMDERMRLFGLESERREALGSSQEENARAVASLKARISQIMEARRKLEQLSSTLERLKFVRGRLDHLEPLRALYEEAARRLSGMRAASEGEKRALSESQKRLLELERDLLERERLVSVEREHGATSARLLALEGLRDQHMQLQARINEEAVRIHSAESRLSSARLQMQELVKSAARRKEIEGSVERMAELERRLSDLTLQRTKKKDLEGLLARRATVSGRLSLRREEMKKAEAEAEANRLREIEVREAILLQQDRELDRLSGEQSRALAEIRAELKMAEGALLAANGSLSKVKSLGEEGLCPTCERPLLGQRGLLIEKYVRAAEEAASERERLSGAVASEARVMDSVTQSRSKLKEAFDSLNADKSRRAALLASISGLTAQVHELESETEQIGSSIEGLGEVSFDAAVFEKVESDLKRIRPIVREHERLSLLLEAMPAIESEIGVREREISDLLEKRARLAEQADSLDYSESEFQMARSLLTSLKGDHDRFTALNERVAAIPTLKERISMQEQKVAALGASIQTVQEEQRLLGYDPQDYATLFKEKKELASSEAESQRLNLLISGEGEAEERLQLASVASERLEKELAASNERLVSLAYKKEEHEATRRVLVRVVEALTSAREEAEKRRVRVEVLNAERVRLEVEALRRADLQTRSDAVHRRSEVVDVTRDLVNGFVDQVLIRIKNEISKAAGEILEEVSGRYSLLKIDDDFNILVEDGGIFYPISRYSGGEIDMIAVSVRVAISEYLMRFGPVGESYSFLILDEVFGSQDQEHREKMIQMLRSLEERFPQIIVISHISDVQGQFDNAILVSEDELGNSRAEVI